MTIGELTKLDIYDEGEQVIVLSGDIVKPNIEYSGKLSDMPEAVKAFDILQVSALGELRVQAMGLNNMGWTEIWIKE